MLEVQAKRDASMLDALRLGFDTVSIGRIFHITEAEAERSIHRARSDERRGYMPAWKVRQIEDETGLRR